MMVVEMLLRPNIPKATNWAVTVVPMLEPYMMVAACARLMMPTFTKPMTITVTAPLLWMAAVPARPIPTPTHLLSPVFANSCLNFRLLADSRLLLIIWQATRKTPMPAINVNIAIITLVTPIVLIIDYMRRLLGIFLSISKKKGAKPEWSRTKNSNNLVKTFRQFNIRPQIYNFFDMETLRRKRVA